MNDFDKLIDDLLPIVESLTSCWPERQTAEFVGYILLGNGRTIDVWENWIKGTVAPAIADRLRSGVTDETPEPIAG